MMKTLIFSVFLFCNFGFSQTIILEPGEKYTVGGQDIVCKNPVTQTPAITCRYTFYKINGYYGTISRTEDITSTSTKPFSALLASCNACKGRIQNGTEYSDYCRFDECYEEATGKSFAVDTDMRRRLPTPCR